MFLMLNGPLGIGKSTLAEALGERIDNSVTLFGDAMAAINPLRGGERAQVHAAMAALIEHHWANGYRHFVVEHHWPTAESLADLVGRLREVAPDEPVRCFLLVLSEAENRSRIARRQEARAIDEREFEWKTFAEESATLSTAGTELGEPFDVSDPVGVLVMRMLGSLGLG
jgi:hypothetical protein